MPKTHKKKNGLRRLQFSIIALIAIGLGIWLPFVSAQSTNPFGHLTDTQWSNFSGNYSSIEVDITPLAGDGDNYYFSNNVYIRNCQIECYAYAGLQTNGYDGTKWIGKMAIFSWWNATTSIAEPNGKAVNFGGEGVGQSVRIPYQWQTGSTYRLKIYLETDGSSKLWGATLTNLSNNQTSRIGRIYAPTGYGLIYGPVTFHERYAGPQSTCKTVSPSQVRFSNMSADNGTVTAKSWNHYYKASLPGCEEYFWTQDDASGYISSVGVKKPVVTQPATPKPSITQPATPVNQPATPTPDSTIPESSQEDITNLQNNVHPESIKSSNIWQYITGSIVGLVLLSVIGFRFYRKLS